MGDYFYQTESSYPMLESPSTTSKRSANMASQEYTGLENADFYFPIDSSWVDSFPEPFPEPYSEQFPEQYLPLMSCDTNHSFHDEPQFPPQFEDFEPHYHQLDVNYLPLENSPPEDTASRRAGSIKPKAFVCEICRNGFTRPADLKRHQTIVHEPVFTDCPREDCTRKGRNGFTRKDHLVEHIRQFHRVPIKKRKCSKRSTGY
ncbi:putative C2H2 finger domain protein [Elaphomyces granulatus]|jgi:hypothetical protein